MVLNEYAMGNFGPNHKYHNLEDVIVRVYI